MWASRDLSHSAHYARSAARCRSLQAPPYSSLALMLRSRAQRGVSKHGRHGPPHPSRRRLRRLLWMRADSDLGGSASQNLYRETLAPDRPRRLDHPRELGALLRRAQRIAGGAAGEAALRADRQPVEVDMPARLV